MHDECVAGMLDGVSIARDIRGVAQKELWDKLVANNDIGVPWRLAGGRWTGGSTRSWSGSCTTPSTTTCKAHESKRL